MNDKRFTLIAALTLLTGSQPTFAQQQLIADQQGHKANFNTRFAQINQQISAAVANRTITAAQAGGLQTNLNHFSGEVEQHYASDGGFTESELAALTAKMNQFAQHVTSGLQPNGNTVGAGQNRSNYSRRNRNRTPLVADQVGIKNNFSTRFAQLDKQIDDAGIARTLSRSQANTLHAALDQLSHDEEDDFASHGGFTQTEVNSLNARLASFAQHVTTTIQVSTNTNVNRNSRNNRNNRRLSWNQERNQFRSNWDRLAPSQRRAIQGNMHSQWDAYHHNGDSRWNTQASATWENEDWDDYSDPGFLDYLHNSNPTVLTQIRSYMGF